MSQIRISESIINWEMFCKILPLKSLIIPIILYKEEDCIICMDNQPSYGYSKCGHVVYCDNCSKQAEQQGNIHRCPLCRVGSKVFELI